MRLGRRPTAIVLFEDDLTGVANKHGPPSVLSRVLSGSQALVPRGSGRGRDDGSSRGRCGSDKSGRSRGGRCRGWRASNLRGGGRWLCGDEPRERTEEKARRRQTGAQRRPPAGERAGRQRTPGGRRGGHGATVFRRRTPESTTPPGGGLVNDRGCGQRNWPTLGPGRPGGMFSQVALPRRLRLTHHLSNTAQPSRFRGNCELATRQRDWRSGRWFGMLVAARVRSPMIAD